MPRTDHWYHAAKQAGYRTRASFKLKQLDEEVHLFSEGDVVVDLGAAPGGWMQVAAEAVGAAGRVIGVDRARIKPIADAEAHIDIIQGDITDDETQSAIRDAAGPGGADVVLSDMAPDMTGEYSLDHARSVHLARTAADIARELLAPGGDVVIKVFQGREFEDFQESIKEDFSYIRTLSPPASRDASSEVFVIGKAFLTAPVRPGDIREVDIVDTGSEGDGVARIEGYTIFVPETTVGETVSVRVTATKPRFGFAERTDQR